MSVAEADVSQGAATGTAPARSRADTRRRLLEAAVALFAERGLHGVTSAQIARRAGVATGTFYLHFPDDRFLQTIGTAAALVDATFLYLFVQKRRRLAAGVPLRQAALA